jgi:hypothetical protein
MRQAWSQRAQWINRVVMTEHQHRLARRLAREVHLRIAAIADMMKSHRSAQCRHLHCHHVADLVHSRFVVARRFNLDQLANVCNHHIAPLDEVRKTPLCLGRVLSGISGRIRASILDRVLD